MKLRNLAIATAMTMVPFAGSATTVTTVGNQTSIFYNNTNSAVDLGDFDLGAEPVGVSALFTETSASGSLLFGAFSSGTKAAKGSIDINIVANGVTYSGTFDGKPLGFSTVDGDFVAAFSTTFADDADVAKFFFEFSGFDPGDQFQVNVAAIPLPASVLMLIGALGGLAFLGRRRNS